MTTPPWCREKVMVYYYYIVQFHFIFCFLNFIVFFQYLVIFNNIIFIIIVFRLGSERLWHLFFMCPLYFFPYSHLSPYLLHLFLCLISFLLFPCASVWEILVHVFQVSYSHTEWYCLFEKQNCPCFGQIFAY